MALRIELNPGAWKQDLSKGLKAPVSNRQRAAGTFLAGLTAFLLTIFSASPTYSVQMLSSGIQYWGIAFVTRFTGVLMNTGYTGMFLTLAFSALVGVTLTNTVIQLRMNRVDLSSLGALPGFLAGGCASCGVGVLSLLGFGGVLASLPYQGNLLRLGGVVLLTFLIVRTGNPETCGIQK
jgi:ABC-type antimicrobial peptide transport system permease subunit